MRKLLIIIVTVAFLILGVNPVWSHRPHDVISQIEISPDYAQDKTVFLIVRNNLFKSINGGETWKRLFRGIDALGGLSGLSLSPVNKDILYLSTYHDGIYKSKDGGTSWEKIDQGLDNLNIDSVDISPSDSQVVFASDTKGGLYKTSDGGSKWSLVVEPTIKVTAIAFSTKNNRIFLGDNKGNLYISEDQGKNWKLIGSIKDSGKITSLSILHEQNILVGTEQKGIFKTVDLGKSFSNISQGIPDKNIRDIVIVNEANKPSNILVSTWDKGFFESTDEGKTWQELSKGLTKDRQADDFKVPHFTELKVSPNFKEDKVLFLAGFNGLFKSVDSGQNWKELETLSPGIIVSFALSPNYKNDSTLAVVTYVRNIYMSQDKGKTWKPVNKGLEVPRFTGKLENENIQDPRRFFDVAFSPNYQSDHNLFATVLWNKFLRSTNQGNSWEIVSLPSSPGEGIRGMTIVPSPQFASDKTIYIGTQYGLIMRSTDGGQKFYVLSKIENRNINEAIAIVISPNFATDKTLYASGLKGIYKTVDAGKSWQPITAKTPLKDLNNIQLAISPNYQVDQTVIAGTSNGVYLTKDGGNSWVKLTSDNYDENGYIEGLAISPNYKNDRTFIFSIRGEGLIKTVDSGQTFAKIGDDSISLSKVNDIPSAHRAIQFSPFYAEDKTIYGMGSSRTELYRSTDGGNTWETIIIPPNNEDSYDLITQLILILTFSNNHWLKILIPVTLALLSYVIFRLFKAREKKHS